MAQFRDQFDAAATPQSAANALKLQVGVHVIAYTAGEALTRVNDTNVTLTLAGTPATALLKATSITVGWTGTLAAARLNSNVVQAVTNDTNVTGSIATQTLTLGWSGTLAIARGGHGQATATAGFNALSPTTTRGDLITRDASNNVRLAVGAANTFLKSNGSDPAWTAGAALTKTDDTNVTLTLGGSATSALVNAASLTLGWSGTLAAARLNSNVVQSVVNDTNVTGSISSQTLTLGWTGTLATARIADDAVTYAKIQNVASDNVFLGRISGAAGNIEELTAANAFTILADAASTSITPTWTATVTNPALGNGTIGGRAVRVGPWIFASIDLVMGSTTTYGSGQWLFQLPSPFNGTAIRSCAVGSVYGLDSGAVFRVGVAFMGGGANTILVVSDGGGAGWGATVPHTWATNDEVRLCLAIPVA